MTLQEQAEYILGLDIKGMLENGCPWVKKECETCILYSNTSKTFIECNNKTLIQKSAKYLLKQKFNLI